MTAIWAANPDAGNHVGFLFGLYQPNSYPGQVHVLHFKISISYLRVDPVLRRLIVESWPSTAAMKPTAA